DLGGADVHTRLSGVADHMAEDDEHALQIVRNIVENLGKTPNSSLKLPTTPEDPVYEVNDLYSLVPRDTKHPMKMREVLARIVDGSRFHEFKPRYGTTLICGFARMYGHTVGIL